MKERKCPTCGIIFTPKSGRQTYCKREITKQCAVCGADFITICTPGGPTTCSNPDCKKKAGYVGSISKTRKCKICGREFKPTCSTQEYCNLPVERTCQYCGKKFTIKCTEQEYHVQTCSFECMNQLGSIHRQESYAATHEVECILCGKLFHPINNTQRICGDRHFRKCVVCGKEFDINYEPSKGLHDIRKTCSDECYTKWMRQVNTDRNPEVHRKYEETMMRLYNVKHPSQSPELFAKAKRTMVERYGSEYALQCPELKAKTIKTNQERWGADWAIGSSAIRKQSENTLKEHYNVTNPMNIPGMVEKVSASYKEKTGYDFPMQNPEVQDKSREYYQQNYGVHHYSQTDEYKEKFQSTSLDRYGTSNPIQNKDIQEKAKQTCLEKYDAECYLSSDEGRERTRNFMNEHYGVDWYSQTAEHKLKILKECTNIDAWMEFTTDCREYILSHYSDKPTYKKLSIDLGVSTDTVCGFIRYHEATDLIKRSSSHMEEELEDFLNSIGIDYYTLHDRNSIKPLEIDISILSTKLGIECNPTATHNCSRPYIEETDIMPYEYHQNKTDLCDKKGIFLFHIFGYEWRHQRPIIESMLKDALGKNDRVIDAENCEIREVSSQDSDMFLENNHRQGSANSPVRLGLYYEGELVSLMTFGKMRNTIGTEETDNLDDCWELVRFCSVLNTSVVGGASKLFKHFVTDYDPIRVRSFSDRAHTRGNLYSNLGFQEIRRSAPGYVWVDLATDIAYNRVNAQKKNICNFLNDDTIDLNKTERQIMIEHGYVQVPDSGTITWEWRTSK